MNKNDYIVVGLMSGTSLDGLDVALCHFSKQEKWQFEIIAAKTFDYLPQWKQKLKSVMDGTALEISLLHIELGKLHGEYVKEFLKNRKEVVDFISSHGHTVFHQPEKGLTLQIGSAAHITAITGFPVVADFRALDVALGGQGAPLVPIGDQLLFAEYDYCLNLGGIANISFHQNGKRLAMDICPCNMPLNVLASELGLEYDQNGNVARGGNIDSLLLTKLNALNFYHKAPPKSLGKEFFDADFCHILNTSINQTNNKLRTCVEHIAQQIAAVVEHHPQRKMLVTGGGAFNTYLIEKIRELAAIELVIPDIQIIQYKAALIFAFLGVLRWRGEANCLSSVTGAMRDNCGGIVCNPLLVQSLYK